MSARIQLEPFADAYLEAAGELLARRHARQRETEPLLALRFEDPAEAEAEIRRLWTTEGASGAVAIVDGVVVGYLIGVPKPVTSWGPNMWVEAAGHAVETAEHVRDLYAYAATTWVEAGQTAHYALVPAHDASVLDAWNRLAFGQQHLHGIRGIPVAPPPTPTDLVIRRAVRSDIPALAALEVVLPAHQGSSPVFSAQSIPTVEENAAEWEDDFDDPEFAVFVAEAGGTVVGSAVGCAIEKSSAHSSLARPDSAGFLGFAAVLPESRGLGAGRALGEAVNWWAAEAGYSSVVTDWRVTNLLSSRTWPRLGFRTTFVRVHRVVGY